MRGHEAVAGHMVASALRARADEAAAAVLARLADEKPACVELVLVVGRDGRLDGVVPIARLLSLDPASRLSEAAGKKFPRVTPDDDQEHAASLALHHGVDALPVVDERGRPLGVMPAQALLQVLRREHVEDLHRLAGIQREASKARHAIEDPPLRRVRHRLPWLLVGLAGGSVATVAMASMEDVLRSNIKIAFFVPALIYLAGAIGTQSEMVAVRGLSLTRSGLGPLLAGELRTGMLIGAILGVLSLTPIWLWSGDVRLAAAVAASIFAAGTFANGVGLLFPWILKLFRFDPAYGAGPATTVVQDVCTILVYFAVLSAFGFSGAR